MTALGKALLRLTAGGLLCAGALSLGGQGAKKELVRFCCACLMLILVMTALPSGQLPQLSLDAREAELARTVEDAQTQVLEQLLLQTEERLAREVERLASLGGISGTARVICTRQQQEITVERVELELSSAPPEGLSRLTETLCRQLAISREQIELREERE